MTSAQARVDCSGYRCPRSITSRVPCVEVADGIKAARFLARWIAVAQGWILDGGEDGYCPACRAAMMAWQGEEVRS